MKTKTKRSSTAATRPVIGWREWVELVSLGADRFKVKVKVDTGARSSALHAFNVERFERDGADWVRFDVHPLQDDSKFTIPAEAPLVDERWVRNSGGKADLRPVIRTTIRFLDVEWEIELTLTRRDMMGFRMLLGRQAIRKRFVVDPARSFVGGKMPRLAPRRRRKKGTPAKRTLPA
jgi:hypothetical protein